MRGKYFTDCHARRHGMPTMCPFSPHCSHPTPFGHRSACGIRLCVSVFSLLFLYLFFCNVHHMHMLERFPAFGSTPAVTNDCTVRQQTPTTTTPPKRAARTRTALVEVFYRHESHHFCMTFRFVPPARSTVRVYRARPPAITSLCRPISNRSGRNSTSETPQFRPPVQRFARLGTLGRGWKTPGHV